MHQSFQQPDMLTQFKFREFWQHLLFSSLLQFNRMLIDRYLNVLFQLPILGLKFFLVRYPSLAGFLEDPGPVQMTNWFSCCLATLCLGYPDFSYLPCSSYGCKSCFLISLKNLYYLFLYFRNLSLLSAVILYCRENMFFQ